MNFEDCKHEKPVLRSSLQAGTPATGIATKLTQLCKECGSTRDREIFSARLRGLTVCSEDVGPWVPEIPKSDAPVV